MKYIVTIARTYGVEAHSRKEAEDTALQLEHLGSAEAPTIDVEPVRHLTEAERVG